MSRFSTDDIVHSLEMLDGRVAAIEKDMPTDKQVNAIKECLGRIEAAIDRLVEVAESIETTE